jgi:quinol monooxygenase YgiN
MSQNHEIRVIAHVQAQPGAEATIREALITLVRATRAEPGCLSYTLHEDPAKAGQFYFYEVYRDQAALDHHMQSPHLAAAFAAVGHLVAAAPVITPVKEVAI